MSTCLNCGCQIAERGPECPECGLPAEAVHTHHTTLGEFVPRWLGKEVVDGIVSRNIDANESDVRRYIAHVLDWTWTPGKATATLQWLRDSGHLPTKKAGGR